VWDLLAPATATRVLADSRSHLAAGALAARLSLLHTSPQCDVLFTPAGATVAVDGVMAAGELHASAHHGVMAAGGGGARVGGAGGAKGSGEAPKAVPAATAVTSTASAAAAATAAVTGESIGGDLGDNLGGNLDGNLGGNPGDDTSLSSSAASSTSFDPTTTSSSSSAAAAAATEIAAEIAAEMATYRSAVEPLRAWHFFAPNMATDLSTSNMASDHSTAYSHAPPAPAAAATMPLPWLQRAAVESASVPRGAWPVWRPLRLPAACRSAGGPSVEALGTALEAAAALDAQHGASTGAEGAPSTAHRAWQADYAAAAVELAYWLRCLHAGASICRVVPAVDPNMDESDEHAHEYAPAALHGAALGELLARHRRPSALRILMVNEQVPLHAC
jgi:hypothetical protein